MEKSIKKETFDKKVSESWQAVLDGDQNALSRLFEKFYSPLLNYGLTLIPREDLVKDSIQELFFTIWNTRKQLSNVKYVKSYLYSSFRRTVYRQAERQDIRNERDQSYSKENFREIPNKEQLIVLRELKDEQKQDLKKAFKVLSPREKEALFLKFHNGLSNQEIGEVMGVNKQSVYNYIHRAIIALKDYLEDYGDSFLKRVTAS